MSAAQRNRAQGIAHAPAQRVEAKRTSRHITTMAAVVMAAAVLRVHTGGRPVLRQDDLGALPGSHAFDAARRVLCHRQHGEVHVSFRAPTPT